MGAKVLNMNSGEAEQGEEKETRQRRSYYAEDRTARYLLVGKDAHGKAAYFIRIVVTGLRPRVVGPFRRKTAAIAAFDSLLGCVAESFMDLANNCPTGGHSNFGHVMAEPPINLVTVR
jgi:hypothetical protein